MTIMKLNKDFLMHKTGDEVIIVPTGKAPFSGIVKGNETLGLILGYLENDISAEEIVSRIEEEYNAPRDVIKKDVRDTVRRLKEIGAIDN